MPCTSGHVARRGMKTKRIKDMPPPTSSTYSPPSSSFASTSLQPSPSTASPATLHNTASTCTYLSAHLLQRTTTTTTSTSRSSVSTTQEASPLGCSAQLDSREPSRSRRRRGMCSRYSLISYIYFIFVVFLAILPVAKCQISIFMCNFEQSSICNMVNSQEDTSSNSLGGSFDWLRLNGRTPTGVGTGLPRTGPSGAYSGTYYIYTEGSDPRQAGDRAEIRTPPLGYSGQACIRFFYSMNGVADSNGNVHMGSLELVVTRASDQQDSVVWGRSGHQAFDWVSEAHEVFLTSNQDRVGWRATRGNDFKSDIALDEISIISGSCSGAIPESQPNTTPAAPTDAPQPYT